MTSPNQPSLSLLGGASTKYPASYSPDVLEAFPNRHPDLDYMVKLNCPEFTSLCPITNQPDFAAVYINYIPDTLLVESKSLKIYLFSFRNHGDFHEDCINIILKDLRGLLSPRFIEVQGKFTPRGGISIDPYTCWGMPDTKYAEMAAYRLQNRGL
jgi:7-cyano-7-deazaguanine reductase